MIHVVRQLERVRREARLLLLLRSGSRWVAALLAVAVVCALTDYVLRFPGWLRAAIGLAVLALALRWIARQALQVWHFRPTVATLALRAERLFPQLNGVLTSGVELATAARHQPWSARTAALAAVSIDRARQQARGVPLRRLVDPRRPLCAFGVACAAAAVVMLSAWAAPTQSATAAARWLTPWRDAPWPKRTRIQQLDHPAVWPADIPLRVKARVDRGYRRAMRVWVHWRLIGPGEQSGDWQHLLMNEHADGDGTFERLLDLPEHEAAPSASSARPQTVEFRFAAGDDESEPQSVTLVQRPALRGLTLGVDPPPYARGLIDARTVDLARQSGQVVTTSVLEGAMVHWQMRLNKPIPRANATLARLLPALAGRVADAKVELSGFDAPAGPTPVGEARIDVTFRLNQTVQSAVDLTDAYDLSNLSEQQYRLEMAADRPPSAAMAEPATDEAVLATAVVPLRAVAQDDVGVESVALESAAPERAGANPSPSEPVTTALHTAVGRSAELAVEHSLDLGPRRLQPGDVVTLTAVAQDVFELDGRRHEPVRSAPRRLNIIDPATLTSQLRSELAGVRQQAIRLEARQQRLLDTAARDAEAPQGQLTRQLEANRNVVAGLRERIARNRLAEPTLSTLVEGAQTLLAEARQASGQAQQGLEQALRNPRQAPARIAEAQQQQKWVRAKLVDLIEHLDQGRDALTLQLQLQQLQQQQGDLAADVRKTLPETIGRSLDQLDEAARKRLGELAGRQAALAQRGRGLAGQMRATAEALARPDASEQDQAAAEALAQAASIAQRQGLDEKMEQAAEATGRNQLAAAGESQGRSLDIMRSMLSQMRRQESRSRQILRRRLLELAQAIARLVERQKGQIQLLEQTRQLAALDGPLAVLRSNTLVVRDQARASRKTQPAAEELQLATTAQAQAIQAVRTDRKPDATAGETEALRHLEAALSLVRRQRQEAQQEQARRTREQLRQAYVKLAERQEELRGQTEPLVSEDALNRRQGAAAAKLGGHQAELRDGAAALVEEHEPPRLFRQVHSRIEVLADDAAGLLRQRRAPPEVLEQQDSVAGMLRQLAWALEQAQRHDSFDTPPGAEAEADSGGAGGGGAGAPLIPPATQLRLLRAMQAGIYERTQQIDGADPADTDRRERRLHGLAVEQRALAAMGEELQELMERSRRRLIERVRRRPPGPDGSRSR